MVSYADFHQSRARRHKAMEMGLHTNLDIPESVNIYLDNGAFKFSRDRIEVSHQDYEEFVEQAKPDWYAIPQDYIPTPQMDDDEQLECLERTMAVNKSYSHDGYVPILHISRHLDEYLRQFEENEQLRSKPICALGGIVPNLLRAPKSMSSGDVLDKVRQVRKAFADRKLHPLWSGWNSNIAHRSVVGNRIQWIQQVGAFGQHGALYSCRALPIVPWLASAIGRYANQIHRN